MREQSRILVWGLLIRTQSTQTTLGDFTIRAAALYPASEQKSSPVDLELSLSTSGLESLFSNARPICSEVVKRGKKKLPVVGSEQVVLVRGPFFVDIYNSLEPQSKPRNAKSWSCNIYRGQDAEVPAFHFNGRFLSVDP